MWPGKRRHRRCVDDPAEGRGGRGGDGGGLRRSIFAPLLVRRGLPAEPLLSSEGGRALWRGRFTARLLNERRRIVNVKLRIVDEKRRIKSE